MVLVSTAQAQTDRAWSKWSQDIRLKADQVREWTDGDWRYLLLEGDAYVEQGLDRVRADSILAGIRLTDDLEPIHTVQLFAQGNVRRNGDGRETATSQEWMGRYETKAKIVLPNPRTLSPTVIDHPLVQRARQMTSASTPPPTPIDSAVVQAEFVTQADGASDDIQPVQAIEPLPNVPGSGPPPAVTGPQPGPVVPNTIGPNLATPGIRRIRWFPRTSQPFNVASSVSPDGISRQWIFTGGVNLIVEEPSTGNTADISADRAVLWTRGAIGGDAGGGGLQSDGSQDVEVYLEGNVYLRQGNPSKPNDIMSVVLFGKQLYYNVNTNQALVLDGTAETFDPKFQVPLVMNAEEIRQLAPGEFFGQAASFTTSLHRGTPGYAIEGNQVYFEEIRERIKNPFTGQEVINADTGEPLEVARHFITGYSNVLRVGNVPVFYWPYVRANAEDPLGPIEDVRIGQSQNLGTIFSVSLDVWQLFGLDYLPIAENTNWLFDIGYFSDRGISAGSRFNYFGQGLLTPSDSYWGNTLGWYLNDNGFDQLGPTRQGLVPETNNRGRFLFQNRYDLDDDTTFITEFSYLSDPNVLESFFEAEYDAGKDQDTVIYAKKSRDNWAITGLVQPRVQDFLPQNEWLPRVDGYLLGQPLLGDRLTYFTHTSAGYANFNVPSELILPGESEFDLGRIDTRHEIDLPVSLGPWEVTPFAIGQFTGYSDTADVNGLGRLYGAAGVRTSLPFYRIFPGVQSDLFYLNGLAHKIAFNLDYTFARSNRDFGELPLLDQLDDDTSDLVRRQNLIRQFGGVLPREFDPRFQAYRRNIFFYPEALDDTDNFRFSITQRLQTKRGPEHQRRIIEWMHLDVGTSYFPNADRDNLGEEIALVDYDYRWNIGDRTAIQSDGLYDPVAETRQINGTFSLQRPPRNLLSLFYSHFSSGPFDSNYIGASSSYRFSNRYAGYFEIGKDLEFPDALNVRAAFSRIGLDFVTTFGVNWNAGRDDFGVDFSILPRVGVRNTFGRSLMQTLPFGVAPAGTDGVVGAQRQAILTDPTF